DRDLGVPVVGERQTVGQYLSSWLATVRPTIRHSSWIRYEELVRLHALPSLGAIVLSRLTGQHLQSLYAAKLAEGLSPTTVGHLHGALTKALGEAARLGLTQRNVAALVRGPRWNDHEIRVFTPEQAHAFLEAIID